MNDVAITEKSTKRDRADIQFIAKRLRSFSLMTLMLILVFACQPDRPVKEENDQADPQQGYLEINGTSTYYRIMGEGPVILFVHGGPVLDHSYFLPYLESLAEDHKLVFYDQRASGRSGLEVDTASMTIKGFAADIESVRRELDLGKIHVLGHSWGGLLAIQYAHDYPEQINGLILSNSIPPDAETWRQESTIVALNATPEDSIKRRAIVSSGMIQQDPTRAIRALMLLSQRAQFHNPDMVEGLNLYIPEDYQKRSAIFGLAYQDVSSYNLTPELSRLSVPTLLIYGKSEPGASLSAPVLDSLIPSSRLELLDECGHFPFIEQPEQYEELVVDFINELSN